MNTHTSHTQSMDQFGRQVAARLDSACNDLPYDISERLRAARTRAVAARRQSQLQTRVATGPVMQNGVLAMHFDDTPRFNFWNGLASALPLAALVVGLICLQSFHTDQRALELAEVDSALLTDDLPPDAYTDSGFLQFLKSKASAPAAD